MNARKIAPAATKLFVLDTNVLMHDPTSLFRFEEHDVYLPIETLEELDHNKRGTSEVTRNARQASRFIEEVMSRSSAPIEQGIALQRYPADTATGKLFLQTEAIIGNLPVNLPASKTDNAIIGVVAFLQERYRDRQIILVSKDINMRIKARAAGLAAEDYYNDKVLEDTDLLYAGARALPTEFWTEHAKGLESWKKDGHTLYRVTGPSVPELVPNEFVYQEGDTPLHARVREVQGKTGVLETCATTLMEKTPCGGLPRATASRISR